MPLIKEKLVETYASRPRIDAKLFKSINDNLAHAFKKLKDLDGYPAIRSIVAKYYDSNADTSVVLEKSVNKVGSRRVVKIGLRINQTHKDWVANGWLLELRDAVNAYNAIADEIRLDTESAYLAFREANPLLLESKSWLGFQLSDPDSYKPIVKISTLLAHLLSLSLKAPYDFTKLIRRDMTISPQAFSEEMRSIFMSTGNESYLQAFAKMAYFSWIADVFDEPVDDLAMIVKTYSSLSEDLNINTDDIIRDVDRALKDTRRRGQIGASGAAAIQEVTSAFKEGDYMRAISSVPAVINSIKEEHEEDVAPHIEDIDL